MTKGTSARPSQTLASVYSLASRTCSCFSAKVALASLAGGLGASAAEKRTTVASSNSGSGSGGGSRTCMGVTGARAWIS